jgi:hypothetical protein
LADQDDVPSDDGRGNKARRLLREAPHTRPASDDPEDVGEIISSTLKHDRARTLGPPGGNLIQTDAEVRGLRTSIQRKYKDPLENAVQKLILAWTPADTHDLLFLAANRHLKAKGLRDFFAVVETAGGIAEAEGKDPSETTTRHFKLWLEQIRQETGSLSIETAAASFIESSDRLFMLLNDNPEMQCAAQSYADAWHWLHLELMGEHELAAKGIDAERGRKAGPEAKRRQAALRSAIIALAYKKFAASEPKEANRKSTKFAAEEIIDAVNKALRDHGLDPVALGTVKNQLPAIIKATK